MVFFVLAMQCMSTVAVVRRETNSWGWTLFMVGYMTALAYVAAFVTYQGGKLLGFSYRYGYSRDYRCYAYRRCSLLYVASMTFKKRPFVFGASPTAATDCGCSSKSKEPSIAA